MKFTQALVTRPSPQSDELVDRLSPYLEAINMPAFRFESLARRVSVDAAWSKAPRRVLIFTSPRAVSFGLPALDDEVLDHCEVASVGPATSRALEARGFRPVQAPGPEFDSEALLTVLTGDSSAGAALILAAPGGREALQRGLASSGWSVRLEPVYERKLVNPEPDAVVRLEGCDHLLSFWTSGVALTHLMGVLTPPAIAALRSGVAVVISGRLAERARELGFTDVRIAPGPSNEDLFRAFSALADGVT